MQPVFERVDWLRGRLPDLREFPGHLIDNPGRLLALVGDRWSAASQVSSEMLASGNPRQSQYSAVDGCKLVSIR